jgi:GntR family transcriptional regulator, transcriptional repressor for pyruvate dehydrogenase complex
MFNAVRINKASQQIVSQIRNQVFEGRLAPGDKLPPENVLMEQFHVSKQTLREAMRALEYLGLIGIRQGTGGGAHIIEVDTEIAKDILANFLYFKNLSLYELSEVRKVIEPYTARKAAESPSSRNLNKMKESIDVSAKALAEQSDPQQMSRYDLAFHRVIAEAGNNPILVLIVDFVESLMADVKGLLKPDRGFSNAVLEAHKRIYDAILNNDGGRASAEMYQHIVEVENFLAMLGEKADLWKRPKLEMYK